MTYKIIAPPVEVGSRWILPSGNLVEILPALTFSGFGYVVCKYVRSNLSVLDAAAGVTLRVEFVEMYGRPA